MDTEVILAVENPLKLAGIADIAFSLSLPRAAIVGKL